VSVEGVFSNFGQLYQALGTNPTSNFLAQNVFENQAKIRTV